MAKLTYTNTQGDVGEITLPDDFESNWGEILSGIVKNLTANEKIVITGATFSGPRGVTEFDGVIFDHCKFINNCFGFCAFKEVKLMDCIISDKEKWISSDEIQIYQNKKLVRKNYKTNEIIAGIVKGRVVSLPNDKYVKVMCTCDFCHKTFARIQSRSNPEFFMKPVPNCDKIVCDKCYADYSLRNKESGHRTYGYRGPLSYYRTPMDRRNTAILGLEMEFEGDFTGWKELEDAHKGTLHYGYDTSVLGQNELSWDCGSYSWWKYLSPLKETCKALKTGGAREGPTAGIHIHVSRPDVNGTEIAERINKDARRTKVLRIAMIAVSLRKDLSKMARYADFDSDCENHHAAISASNHGTTEFRIFASSLDPNIILKRLLLCKTWFNLSASGVRGADLLTRLPKHLKQFILDCAKEQVKDDILSDSDMDALTKTLN